MFPIRIPLLEEGETQITLAAWEIPWFKSDRELSSKAKTKEGAHQITEGGEEEGQEAVEEDGGGLPIQAVHQYEQQDECCQER